MTANGASLTGITWLYPLGGYPSGIKFRSLIRRQLYARATAKMDTMTIIIEMQSDEQQQHAQRSVLFLMLLLTFVLGDSELVSV